ncbi:quinoprotein dehydrogenase-associated SoxYZ-like carrier [Nevskia ramosa]|uniref:quinoprotein dehydrogenase-associated SoxYZ-like carrier n=1 Tax=Nevskia ramosa TaxID=64002 RepID=UPI0003B6D684|nr:quinoprotein dehydrogenase-associated SoxYZ-like carrier [Nevskia ramosa]
MFLFQHWQRVALVGLLAAFVPQVFAAPADPAPQASAAPIWPKVRNGLFGSRAIDENAGEIIVLEAPNRAEDASTVPIAIRTKIVQSPTRYVQKLYLLVDNNPSPIAAVFELTPDSGRADIETRIRIEQYTDVRAIAELNDGSLYMASHYVKASGGCSAPAGKDPKEALRNAGRIKFRVDGPLEAGKPAAVQLAISHPNASGLVLDQVSRLYEPAYYVRKLSVRYGDKPILTADIDFSISENPNFRFYFLPSGDGALHADVVDTKDLSFSSEVAVKLGSVASTTR